MLVGLNMVLSFSIRFAESRAHASATVLRDEFCYDEGFQHHFRRHRLQLFTSLPRRRHGLGGGGLSDALSGWVLGR